MHVHASIQRHTKHSNREAGAGGHYYTHTLRRFKGTVCKGDKYKVCHQITRYNARDELRTKISQFQEIRKTSGVVRNDMTNEQQWRLTKRIIEHCKKKEAKRPQQFDNRGHKLKVEEFPEMSKITESVFESGSTDDKLGGGLESHPRLITATRYRTPDNLTFMRQARKILLEFGPPNFTVSLSSCYNYTENYKKIRMKPSAIMPEGTLMQIYLYIIHHVMPLLIISS